MHFFSTSNTSVYREVLISLISKSTPPFFTAPFLEQFLNPQVRINKIVHEHTVDYQPSLSELTLRIHPLIFLVTHNKFISPKYFSNYFSNLYIPAWLRKSYDVNSVKITNKYIYE